MAMGKEFSAKCNLGEGDSLVTTLSKLVSSIAHPKKIMLEDYTFNVTESKEFGEFVNTIKKCLPENEMIVGRFSDHVVLLSDDDFAGFVKYSTEVNTRIKMDPATGTVAGNALFTEEFLPPECILYSLIFFTNTHSSQADEAGSQRLSSSDVKEEFKKLFHEDIFQIGGDSTLGKGLVKKKIWEER